MSVNKERHCLANSFGGVLQGSVLGPLLFLVSSNELATSIKSPSDLFAGNADILCNPRGELVRIDPSTICTR